MPVSLAPVKMVDSFGVSRVFSFYRARCLMETVGL